MKFCYIDESEAGDKDVVVAAGLIVDGSRMHLTKSAWAELLDNMSARLGSTLHEFKASDLYRGAGRWHGMAAPDRAQVIGDVIDWIAERKHAIVYSGVLATRYAANTRPERADLPDAWCAADRHLLLALQRCHQSLVAPKGHTVVVIDHGAHQDHLVGFVRCPEPWTDNYYGRRRGADRLDQIVDVPYFVDSVHAVLVQTADLCAYVLRRYVELHDLMRPERYIAEGRIVWPSGRGHWRIGLHEAISGRPDGGRQRTTCFERSLHHLSSSFDLDRSPQVAMES